MVADFMVLGSYTPELGFGAYHFIRVVQIVFHAFLFLTISTL